jgi:hypothetical protein
MNYTIFLKLFLELNLPGMCSCRSEFDQLANKNSITNPRFTSKEAKRKIEENTVHSSRKK